MSPRRATQPSWRWSRASIGAAGIEATSWSCFAASTGTGGTAFSTRSFRRSYVTPGWAGVSPISWCALLSPESQVPSDKPKAPNPSPTCNLKLATCSFPSCNLQLSSSKRQAKSPESLSHLQLETCSLQLLVLQLETCN
jgi:hypothetical protein